MVKPPLVICRVPEVWLTSSRKQPMVVLAHIFCVGRSGCRGRLLCRKLDCVCRVICSGFCNWCLGYLQVHSACTSLPTIRKLCGLTIRSSGPLRVGRECYHASSRQRPL